MKDVKSLAAFRFCLTRRENCVILSNLSVIA